MAPLKLGQLPNRETTKITFSASAQLHDLLDTYAEAYEREYGQREKIADLIPFMLETFIQSDKAFQKSRRESGSPSLQS